MKKLIATLTFTCLATLFSYGAHPADKDDHLVFEGGEGAGKGKHIVLIAGDEEYRSEEAMPMLGQLLSKHHGFKATVLFSLDEKGDVSPRSQESLSHSESLDSADLIVTSIRFRNWNDASMERFEKAYLRGTPFVTLRTSNHAFKFPADSQWAKYSFNAKAKTSWEGGFGMHVLGMTWIAHHGKHKVEGGRSVIEQANKDHAILNGVGTIFVESDIYRAKPPEDVTILLRGEVTENLEPDSKTVEAKNDPMQPIAWTRFHENDSGKTNRIFNTTMGASSDLDDENLRRLVVNGCYWGLDLEIPKEAKVSIPESWKPTFYGSKERPRNKKPAYFIHSEVLVPAQSSVPAQGKNLSIKDGEHITIVGAGLASRMMKYSHFETELQLRNPSKKLVIRNIADEGNTPGFRPHAGRSFENQFAFPGAKELVRSEFQVDSNPKGHFETPDQWHARLKTDTIIAFFGYNSSFGGPSDVDRFKKELAAYIKHLKAQKYNGKSAPQLAFVSSTAIQDLSATHHTPKGDEQNKNIALYTEAMREVCAAHGVTFIDLYAPSKAHFDSVNEPLTVDGALLTDKGYQWLATRLADALYGKSETEKKHQDLVQSAVAEKNWVWHNLFKVPNGVHVFGKRNKPFGPQNYPAELKKLAEMTALRDQATWKALKGEKFDLAAADAKTHKLPETKTNYTPSNKNGETRYLSGEETVKHLKVPEGYKIELFADEKMFPELANPCQMSFDNKGRLWVGCMPSYPHWRPGDPRPKDSLLILEDTDNDGKADKRTVFADDLHLCIGFELSAEGVYVSQADSLVLLTDTDGDDKYDAKEYLLSGFDDHDTHHAISAFTADPSGAIYMGEGVFLHSNVESVYGTTRGTNGGFYRYNPKRRHLERTAQLEIPNPWGIAFDRWGQQFFLFTSGSFMNWMAPGTVKSLYGYNMEASRNLLRSNRVRPNSGLEIISSRHFPDEVQGDLLLNNNISFLGTKQHPVSEDGTGYKLGFRHDMLMSEEGNFRPVDLEFAPDGSLYVIDWSNVLIGHMQHSARDPLRDHVHGRVYRITYPSRPLIKPAKIDGASLAELLENLKLHEDRSRYRTRRELRGRDTSEVLTATKKWIADLDKSDKNYEHHLLEALWVTWGHDAIDQDLLHQLLKSGDHRVRAAAVRAVRYNTHAVSDYADLLKTAAADKHGRVRVEAITAASWLEKSEGMAILDAAEKTGHDDWTEGSMKHARAALTKTPVVKPKEVAKIPRWLRKKEDKLLYTLGKEVYHRDAHCATCHQANGKGLPDAGFPPLTRTKWVNEDPERLILITLKGLTGEIEVKGKKYAGAMTPFEGLLNDKETAAVLTYVRNSFGNKASVIMPEQVKKIRAAHKDKPELLQAPQLLKQYPHR